MELRGSSVFLRPGEDSDLQRSCEIMSDPTVMEHLLGLSKLPEGWTLEQMRGRFARLRANAQNGRGLDFVVLDARGGEFIGQCGLPRMNPDQGNGEFGIILDVPAWGGPAAAECHLLCLRHAFETVGLHRVEFQTATDNHRMRGFFQSCGIIHEGSRREAFRQGETHVDSEVYSVLAQEWPALKGQLEARLAKRLG